MRNWIHTAITEQGHSFDELLGEAHPGNGLTTSSNPTLGPMQHKMLLERGGVGAVDPNKTTWLGGICSLFTGDTEAIRTKAVRFNSVEEFYAWLASWYPRLDQVHDTVAVPPRSCRRLVYVVEDSLFGRRVGKQTGLEPRGVGQAFKAVHQEYGAGVIERWLRNYGYRGEIQVVYTSELERDLDMAIRFWENGMGKLKNVPRDLMKVRLMYTPAWPMILGLDQVVIAEPFHHGTVKPHPWKSEVPFYGYLPYWSSQGPTRDLRAEETTNRSNWRSFQVDPVWSQINLGFSSQSPLTYPDDRFRTCTLMDLESFYGS